MKIEIRSVDEYGLAAAAGIMRGDKLLKVNGREVNDYIDYSYCTAEESTELEIEKQDGTTEKVVLDTASGYIGIEFDSPVFDGVKVCANKCMFCFMDQSPEGMRDSLYLKDDDYRLSFMHGNYITLTNLKEKDWQRIKEQRLSPLFISVHTLNPDLRVKMLKNPKAAEIKDQLARLHDIGISFFVQLVVCRGINDGKQLDATLEGLLEYKDSIMGIGVVPAGMTDYRANLEVLQAFDAKTAAKTIACISKWQKFFMAETGMRLVYAADEFYSLCSRRLPQSNYYEGYEMLEDGIGMLRKLTDQFRRNARGKDFTAAAPKDIVTSQSAYPYLETLLNRYVKPQNQRVNLVTARNRFYGGNVDVSGLLTAQDIYDIAQELKTTTLLLPENMFNQDNLTLDGATVDDIAKKTGKNVKIVCNDGRALVQAILA